MKENRQNKPSCQNNTNHPAIGEKFKIVIVGMIINCISINCLVQRVDIKIRAESGTKDREIFYNFKSIRPESKATVGKISLAVKTLIKFGEDDVPTKPGNCQKETQGYKKVGSSSPARKFPLNQNKENYPGNNDTQNPAAA